MAALAVHLLWPTPASAQLLDPVPFWKTDFSLDPTLAGVDPNGDGMPDWFIRGGQTFIAGGGNLGALATDQGRSVWHHATTDSIGSTSDAVLDSAPLRRLPRLARSPVRRSLLGPLPPEEM